MFLLTFYLPRLDDCQMLLFLVISAMLQYSLPWQQHQKTVTAVFFNFQLRLAVA